MNLVSIIVPVYKVEQYLPRCIDSILQQTYTDFELILVDDGSPDGCGEICDLYAEKDPRVQVIHQTNKGLSGARNAGIDVAKGVYIGFVDSDDYIDAKMYALLVESLEQSRSQMAVCGWYETYPDREIAKWNRGNNQICSGEDKFSAVVLNTGYAGFACNKLFCANLIHKHHLRFDETTYLMEDRPFVCKYVTYADKVSTVARSLYFYVQRNDSLLHKKVTLKGIDAKVKMRSDVMAMLEEQSCHALVIEEKAYQCIDAAEGVCIAQDYKDKQAEKYFHTIFMNNYVFVRQARTVTKAGRLKCRAMKCTKWLYRGMRKSHTLMQMVSQRYQEKRMEK